MQCLLSFIFSSGVMFVLHITNYSTLVFVCKITCILFKCLHILHAYLAMFCVEFAYQMSSIRGQLIMSRVRLVERVFGASGVGHGA